MCATHSNSKSLHFLQMMMPLTRYYNPLKGISEIAYNTSKSPGVIVQEMALAKLIELSLLLQPQLLVFPASRLSVRPQGCEYTRLCLRKAARPCASSCRDSTNIHQAVQPRPRHTKLKQAFRSRSSQR